MKNDLDDVALLVMLEMIVSGRKFETHIEKLRSDTPRRMEIRALVAPGALKKLGEASAHRVADAFVRMLSRVEDPNLRAQLIERVAIEMMSSIR